MSYKYYRETVTQYHTHTLIFSQIDIQTNNSYYNSTNKFCSQITRAQIVTELTAALHHYRPAVSSQPFQVFRMKPIQ